MTPRARRAGDEQPVPKVFATAEEIDRGMGKLRRRLDELNALDPAVHRSEGPERDNVESSIRATVLEVFGPQSPEFREHQNLQLWQGAIMMGMSSDYRQHCFAEGINHARVLVEGLIRRLEEKRADIVPSHPEASKPVSADVARRVFLVHGRDEAVLQSTARFIAQLGLAPIILHEQPNQGRTIIEKFTDHSEVGFAVVLLTPDDKGGLKDAPPESLQPRARQNVILELGFFLGRLGRARVCALYAAGVEIPSDYSGVLFVSLDPAGQWKFEIAKELKAAGLPVDLNKVIS